MAESAQALDYAPPSDARRKRIRRIMSLILLIVLVPWIGTYAPQWGRWLKQEYSYWQQMRDMSRRMASTAPADTVVWDNATASPSTPPIVFQHSRTAGNGTKALVVIEFIAGRSGHGPHLCATIYDPATLHKSTRHNGPFVAFEDDKLLAGDLTLKLFAGQPDPNDDSHFTIRYKAESESGTLDGYFDPPATTANSWEFGNIRILRLRDFDLANVSH